MINTESLRTKSMDSQFKKIEEMICHAVSDYKHGVNNVLFAEEYGGIDALRNELFLLIENWEQKLIIREFLNHQLIGATVEFEDNKYTCTGAIKTDEGLCFRLLDIDNKDEFWTVPRPTFGEIKFSDFRRNSRLP